MGTDELHIFPHTPLVLMDNLVSSLMIITLSLPLSLFPSSPFLPPSFPLSLSFFLSLSSSQEDGFKLYTAYCTNYNSSMLCLQQLLMSEKHNQFLDQCQRNLKHSLPLSAQLIKPVQRIMRYHLLLHVSHMMVM